MRERALATIRKYDMLKNGDRIIIGASGGADSTALLHLLHELSGDFGLSLMAVYIDHGIRGAEARADGEFVAGICEALGIPCKIIFRDVKALAAARKISVEEAGRAARYEEWYALLDTGAWDKAALGHNMNDTAETLLMRIARGSGATGLSGIPPVRGRIIRPLSECPRESVERYLAAAKIPFRTDFTNNLDIYTRNKIRHNVLRVLCEINPSAVANIAKTAALLREEDGFISSLAEEAFRDATVKKSDTEIFLDKDRLSSLNTVIARRVIRLAISHILKSAEDISLAHAESVLSLLDKPTGKAVSLPRGAFCAKEYGLLRFGGKPENKTAGFSYKLRAGETVYIKELDKYVSLLLNCEKKQIKSDNLCTKTFDYDKIKGVIEIRTRQKGDKIRIKGAESGKSIKKYLIDEKIPARERDALPLVTRGSDVLWIPGRRVSDFYKADSDTANPLTITFWEEV